MNRTSPTASSGPSIAAHSRYRPAHSAIAAVVVFVLALLCAAALVWGLERRDLEQRRTDAYRVATDQAQALQQSLEASMSATQALAALVVQGQGNLESFESIAAQLHAYYPGIAAMGVSPAGRIAKVYPLEGNEALLGFDQLNNQQQGPEAARARDTASLTLAGPMPLRQGSVGVVGRLPVFLLDEHNDSVFWGFTFVTLRLQEWLNQAQLHHLESRGYRYRLWRTVPHTQQVQDIAQSQQPPGEEVVSRQIHLPNGMWTLDLAPAPGWHAEGRLALRAGLALLFGLLMAFLTRLFWEVRSNKRKLESQVAERTAQIRQTQQQLQATLDALPDLVLETDLQGTVHMVHRPPQERHSLAFEPVVGQQPGEFLPEAAAQTVLDVLAAAMRNDMARGHVMPLHPPGRDPVWYELSAARKHTDPAEAARFVLIVRDVSAQHRTQAALQLTQRAFDQSGEAIMLLDAKYRLLQVNSAFSRITGFEADEVIGQPLERFIGNAGPSSSVLEALWSKIRQSGHWEGELLSCRKDRRVYPQWLSLSSVRDAKGQDPHHIGIFRDHSAQHEAQQKIQHLAHFDPVTALPNRVLLAERAGRDIAHEKTRDGHLALLFIDLDHFKNINDTLGHRAGDALLVAVSKRLQASVRQHDTLARLGGDEFLLVLPGTEADGAAVVASQLLAAMTRPIRLGAQELSITLSIGIAMFPDDGLDFDTLYQRADAALFRSKRAGRNRFSFFTADLEARSARTLLLENAMHRALEREQFSLLYQPQVQLDTGRIIGAEALLRWRHPELGVISPAEFIPIAENSGQIVAIGEWVLRTAMRDAKAWLDEGLVLRTISVNISAVQFRSPQLPEMIAQCLRDTGLPPQRLELELTEGVAIDDPEAALAIMQQLHERGPRLSMDDFGTGYSCLSHLKRFPLYKLKIDQSFVRDLDTSASDQAIVGAIVHMAQSLGMVITAEGVETESQREFLRTQGCDEAQGYLFSRPVPASELRALLREQQGVSSSEAP